MDPVNMLDLDLEEDEEERTKCKKCLAGCRSVTTFFLSHVGLISLVIAYCVMGAFTFESLEKQHELDVKNNIKNVRAAVSKYLWDMTLKSPYIEPKTWKENATNRLQAFETDLVKLMKKGGWDGIESNETQQWTFSGALFYSIVVITTIGYGHIAPKTDWGKIVTIFYAILGIPLMLLCLSHIGDFFAKSFRVIYWKVCCYMCNRRTRVIRSPPLQRRFGGSTRGPPRRSIRTRSARTSQRSADSQASDPAVYARGANFRRVQSHEDFRLTIPISPSSSFRAPRRFSPSSSFRTSRKFSPSPHRATLRPNDAETRNVQQRSTRSAEPVVLPISSTLPVLCNKYAEEVPMDRAEFGKFRNSRMKMQPVEQFQLEDYWDEDDDYLWEEEVKKRPVPIWLCVLLVFSYILCGAALFSKWENWPFLDSAYFCFVTLTTIGFGDFVPAQKVKIDVEVSIALCSLYLLFGISLLAMSFNLVQEQVISSVKRIASHLGIIREEDDD